MFVLLPKKSAIRHGGFTLIELIVTVAIMSLLVGGGIAGFLTFSDRQEVQTTAKNLQQLLRTAQGKARVRDTPTCIDPTARLQGYRVHLDENSAVIHPLCAPEGTPVGDPADFTDQNTVEGSTTIPIGVSIAAVDYIDFYTLHRGMYIAGGATDTEIRIEGTVDWCFSVYTSGAVTEPGECP